MKTYNTYFGRELDGLLDNYGPDCLLLRYLDSEILYSLDLRGIGHPQH